ncbi:SDR family oxidoreductase [Nocardia mexicana]|uniref:Thioester reductase-like protein n=1 Tax=Nocardia mexicana TaxID=279262 RepID=A0A370GNV5_9NOCA|nr:SDR family oxidoreductase [Nocardia mexicana]RDI44946.1 thioester reductase-like protein [Nocardia mexicana]
MSDRTAVLVTGASGLVGSEVVSRLAARGRPSIAVTHRNPRIALGDGRVVEAAEFGTAAPVTYVRGNVREPGFGLSEELSDRLGQSVGAVVHSAATTAFDAPQPLYDELNVAGTAHAIELAQRWDVPLIYISTAYVAGVRDGAVAESDYDRGQSFANGYERSKFQAEGLVRAAAGLRWAIVRPAIVTGDAETGVIRDYKNMYTMVKMIVEGKLRTLPGRYTATLALAPLDHVADVATAVVERFDDVEGRVFHATGAAPLSLREISDVLAEYPSFGVPTFVPTATFALDDLDDLEREYYRRIGAQYVSYLDHQPVFDATNTRDLLGLTPPETGKDYLRAVLDHCLESGYLGAALPDLAELMSEIN